MFNGSFDCASNFVKSFDTSKEAFEHLEAIKRNYDEGTNNSCGDNWKCAFCEKTKTLLIRGSGKMKDYEYNWDKKVLTTLCSSKRRQQQIKNAVDKRITTIGKYAFYKCSFLTSLTISNNATTINDYAFNDCRNFSSSNVPKKVQERKDKIFSNYKI